MDIISELYNVVLNRQKDPQEGSYTNYLLEAGTEKIAKKLGEEAVETAIAAAKRSKTEVVEEISDVIYQRSLEAEEADASSFQKLENSR